MLLISVEKTCFLNPTWWLLFGFWGLGIKTGFCKKAQLDGFWNFDGFLVIRMSIAR